MFMTFRKCVYTSSASRKIFHSLPGACSSNLGVLQQAVREKSSVTTKGDVRWDVRLLKLDDIPQLLGFVRQQQGFDVVESCLHSWLKKDPNGIRVAITGRDEIVGVVGGVKNGDNDDDMCFAGLYLVKPEYRNKGIGSSLCYQALEHCGTRNVGLNSASWNLKHFRDLGGFPIQETLFTSIDYHTTTWPLDFTFLANTPPPGISICPFHSSHLPSIFTYDFDLIGFKRTSALALNLMEAGSRTLVALRSDGACAGFGTVKVTCTGKARVGPLYGDEPEVAAVLLRRLGEMMTHEHVEGFKFVTTCANRHAVQWMDRLGADVNVEGHRLYSRKKLDVNLQKVYGQFDISFAPF